MGPPIASFLSVGAKDWIIIEPFGEFSGRGGLEKRKEHRLFEVGAEKRRGGGTEEKDKRMLPCSFTLRLCSAPGSRASPQRRPGRLVARSHVTLFTGIAELVGEIDRTRTLPQFIVTTLTLSTHCIIQNYSIPEIVTLRNTQVSQNSHA